MEFKSLVEALIYPVTYEQFTDKSYEREKVVLNDISSLKVTNCYSDSRESKNWIVEIVINDKKHKFEDYWIEDNMDNARMYYHSEISHEVRNNIFKPYLLSRIITQLESELEL
jgi:hypothetical protein